MIADAWRQCRLHERGQCQDWIDRQWIDRHTVGFEELRKAVMTYELDHASELCGVPARDIHAAAEIIGRAEALFSTVLQGVYQSNQATAAAVQVNNINLLRGMLGRPGADKGLHAPGPDDVGLHPPPADKYVFWRKVAGHAVLDSVR